MLKTSFVGKMAKSLFYRVLRDDLNGERFGKVLWGIGLRNVGKNLNKLQNPAHFLVRSPLVTSNTRPIRSKVGKRLQVRSLYRATSPEIMVSALPPTLTSVISFVSLAEISTSMRLGRSISKPCSTTMLATPFSGSTIPFATRYAPRAPAALPGAARPAAGR